MTALERLREWFNGDKRPEKSAWITGDTVETRAILELADRLEALEAKQPAATTECPPEPFRITKLGKYRMRNVQIASVTWSKSDEVYGVARGPDNRYHGETRYWCHATGLVHPPSITEHDIVAGPLADEPQQEPEMAGLRGIMRFTAGQEPRPLSPTYMLDRVEVVIDLSKVPASAIVKPAQKRETLQDRIAAYLNDQAPLPSYSNAAAEILAMVKADSLESGQ